MDIGRQPLWPRIWETFGEDVRLSEELGKSYIQGHQGSDLKNRTKSAVCLKHYIGYGTPYNGRDRSVAWIPENLLREYFLPPFESALIAGAQTVMLNSGDVNGLPGHVNYHYITEILKGELKFDGFTVSDWEDINRLYARDKVAASPEEAVRMSIMAGVHMSMVPYNCSFIDHCVNLYNKDKLFVDRVNDAVLRILRVKKQIGLLVHSDSIYPKEEDLINIGTMESDNIALDAARECIIMVKNDNILPLSKTEKILVSGPSASLLKVLNGGWSYKWQGNVESYFQTFSDRKYNTIFDAISLKSPENVIYKQGANFTEITQDFNDIISSAQSVDVVILCIGEDTYTETPGNIDNLMISDPQMQLATKLLDTGIPVIVVFIGGRPRTITSIVKKAKAVLLGFLPGNRGGDAIADIIFGDYNPKGKLPITYPKGPNGAMNYDFKPLEDYEVNNGVNVASYFDAIFQFGFGLSYTQFEYSNLQINQKKITEPSGVTGSVTVINIGDRAGKETVIVYLNDEVGSLSRPVKQMKFFKKVNLNPGDSETVNFELTRNDMSFINLKNQRIVESGNFNIYVGNLTVSFELIAKSNEYQNNAGDNISVGKKFLIYSIAIIIGFFH